LKSRLLPSEHLHINAIIAETTKKDDFEKLYDNTNLKAFFYDNNGNFVAKNQAGEIKYDSQYFDKRWREYIQVGFSSISFEQWVLLHFELNTSAFYNSREIIHYFDLKGYFNQHFQKGWFLYEKRGLPIIKEFLSTVKEAIKNAKTINKLNISQKHYETNPYSDVYRLIYALYHPSKSIV
jgi:RloB-like protein